uniref:Uncharacterized protein n=1 Tax=Pithovirus LCPAC403 TaxID=2506596 RepID=A0A481ZAL9_9VIRU|nr:MAG: hypothetical protein LCPAC403_00920 [Pithovirus LCPAC403]
MNNSLTFAANCVNESYTNSYLIAEAPYKNAILIASADLKKSQERFSRKTGFNIRPRVRKDWKMESVDAYLRRRYGMCKKYHNENIKIIDSEINLNNAWDIYLSWFESMHDLHIFYKPV